MDGALTMRMVVMITMMVAMIMVIMRMAVMKMVVMLMVVMRMTEFNSWICNHSGTRGCNYPKIAGAHNSKCMGKCTFTLQSHQNGTCQM